MPLILPGNVASATAPTTYEIANSCRFDGSSSFLAFTLGSETNRDKWTWSCWFKRSKISTTSVLHHIYIDGDNHNFFKFDSSDALNYNNETGASVTGKLFTNALYRDVSAWYHAMIVYDSANATAGNRMRMYVNGTEVTSFETDTQPSSGQDSFFYNTKVINIGRDQRGTSGFWDGYMAEIIYCDGQAYGPDKFGEFNSDSPRIWQPIDPAKQSLTFGNNGCWLDFEDSSAMGNDVSGNNNDWSVTGIAATDQTTDSPTNNFCTLNALDSFYRATWGGYSEGNTKATTSSTGGDYAYATTTIGLTAGKWYWEQKIVQNASNYDWAGVTGQIPINDTDYVGKPATGYGYLSDGKKWNNNTEASYGDTFTDDDIISVALDLDNLKIYFAKNGTWQNSGDPTTGATGTGAAYTVTAVASTPAGAYFPTCGDYAGGAGVYAMNFGNPSYANSSDAADANGYGKFEYAPPSGYLAICTKNLGSDGG